MPTAALTTLGCKVNQAESEELWAALLSRGVSPVGFDEVADVYVVNSCSVTSEADHKSRRLARAALRTNPRALVILAGCYASEADRRTAELPAQIVLVPSEEKKSIPDLVGERLALPDGPAVSVGAARAGKRTRAMVKVQDGCDNYCAYCVVPLARGKPRSRPLADVVAQVRALAGSGVREVVLTGINLGRYTSDGADLVDLAGVLLETPIHRLRLSSIEPEHVTDRLVDFVAASDRVCPHLHVPMQSGSDAVLERMGRTYRAAAFADLAGRVKTARPMMALTTDVIAGFPGETDADFDATVRLLEEVAPLKAHVFKYSARPGTGAATLPGQVDSKEKAARARRLAALDAGLGIRFVEGLVGVGLEILVEDARDGTLTGLAENYVRCIFKGDDSWRGSIVPITGTAAHGRVLHGELRDG